MKKNKIRKRILTLLLATVLAIMPVVRNPVITYARKTNESIISKQKQIEKEKKSRQSLKQSLNDLEAVKKQLEKSKSDLNTYISDLDSKLTEIQKKIDSIKGQITDKENEIAETEKELEEAKSIQMAQYEAMKERIRFMYERGSTYMLDLLFESDNFADMLNKAEYVSKVSEYDQKKLQEYIETTELVQLTKEALEEEKQTLEEAKKTVEQDEKDMEALMAEKKKQLEAVNSDISNKSAAIAEYEAQIADENATIAALEKAVAAEEAELNKPKVTYDGGMFKWPCPGYSRISDDFGMRMHPTLGIKKMHNGLDMAAPTGTSILAAYKGTVVAAAYSGSMGNYVMIDHGGGLYTVYMHASALYVSAGTTVSAGQSIAAVGSTGRSTGPHLHFGVRLNGSYVNPWNYLR